MKKLLLLSAVLLGGVAVSQAGVRFDFGIPFPAPPVVVAPPAYVAPAPTYIDPDDDDAPWYDYAPAPDCYAEPPVVVGPPAFDFQFGHEPYWEHFRDEFHRDHDFDRGYGHDYYYRGYNRDFHRDYNRDFHRDFNRGYNRGYGEHHDWGRGGHRR